ncbi:hypothetical protein ACA910_009191 [Epithemia clementina (nom. ined.)]
MKPTTTTATTSLSLWGCAWLLLPPTTKLTPWRRSAWFRFGIFLWLLAFGLFGGSPSWHHFWDLGNKPESQHRPNGGGGLQRHTPTTRPDTSQTGVTAATQNATTTTTTRVAWTNPTTTTTTTQDRNHDTKETNSRTTTTTTSPPFLLSSSLSPACRPHWGNFDHANPSSSIRRLYLAHTRKAGGSYLRRFFTYVTQIYNWTLDAHEAEPVEVPLRRQQMEDTTLYVTHLRHPVDRILSQYRYDGRWSCDQLEHNQTGFEPTPQNSQTLDDFLQHSEPARDRQVPQQGPHHNSCPTTASLERNPPSRPPRLWQCTQNCYMRWYGSPFNCLHQHNLSESYHSTLNNLYQQFHLVIILEWLAIPEYRQGLFQMFGLLHHPHPHYPNVLLNFRKDMYCDAISKYWNRRYPAVLPNKTIQQIHRDNQWDIALYNTITNCAGNGRTGAAAVVFPPSLVRPTHQYPFSLPDAAAAAKENSA